MLPHSQGLHRDDHRNTSGEEGYVAVSGMRRRRRLIVPEVVDGGTYAELVGAIGGLLERARERIATTANTALVETYWETGRYIVEYEQNGSDRAKYGSRLLSTLARDLTLKHGSGFNRNNLQYMRKLYRAFPICTTLSCKLSWSHYLEMLKCSDELEIGFYVAECVRSNWNVRELRRQMKSSLFERLALSKDKQGVLELAHKGNEVQSPEDILRDHYVLEFSGIKPGVRLRTRLFTPTIMVAAASSSRNRRRRSASPILAFSGLTRRLPWRAEPATPEMRTSSTSSPSSTSANGPAWALPIFTGTGRNTAFLNLSSRRNTIPTESRSLSTRIPAKARPLGPRVPQKRSKVPQ